ncbi:MAG: hypothetical protein ACREIV_07700, partial [Planctomycetaceae bacterium]
MSRRRRGEELAFGSDSFLDVIANIVGILIILTVVAGLRVSRAPVPAVIASADGARADQAILPDEIPLVEFFEPDLPEPAGNQLVVIETGPVAPERGPAFSEQPGFSNPSPHLLQQADKLREELTALAAARMKADRAQAAAAKTADASAELDALSARLDARREELEDGRHSLLTFDESLAGAERRLAEMRFQVAEEERREGPVETIEHHVTPISQVVEGQEIHFQVLGGRVAYVPVEELVSLVKAEILERRDWLLKARSYEGTVGPVQGYSMTFLVERKEATGIDGIRRGGGFVTVGVSWWKIHPQPTLIAETADEALRPSSRFVRALN